MRILVSNDDGYSAPGSQLLVYVLKELGYDIVVASPRSQQTATGASINYNGFTWEKQTINDVTYYIVDGTPNDAMELLNLQKEDTFDLAISGINWGPNLGSLQYRSGTYCAAVAAIGVGNTKKAISISWDVPKDLWFKNHDSRTIQNDYKETPVEMAKYVLKLCIEHNLWGAEIISINMPKEQTEEYEFVKFAYQEKDSYQMNNYTKGNKFKYSVGINKNPPDADTDIGALNRGHIAITPARYYLGDMEVLSNIKKEKS